MGVVAFAGQYEPIGQTQPVADDIPMPQYAPPRRDVTHAPEQAEVERPVLAPKRNAGQGMQAVDWVDGENAPNAHGTHDDCPVKGLNVPAEHGVHAV